MLKPHLKSFTRPVSFDTNKIIIWQTLWLSGPTRISNVDCVLNKHLSRCKSFGSQEFGFVTENEASTTTKPVTTPSRPEKLSQLSRIPLTRPPSFQRIPKFEVVRVESKLEPQDIGQHIICDPGSGVGCPRPEVSQQTGDCDTFPLAPGCR